MSHAGKTAKIMVRLPAEIEQIADELPPQEKKCRMAGEGKTPAEWPEPVKVLLAVVFCSTPALSRVTSICARKPGTARYSASWA